MTSSKIPSKPDLAIYSEAQSSATQLPSSKSSKEKEQKTELFSGSREKVVERKLEQKSGSLGGFRLEVTNVFRDFVQGLYANRVPLDHPKMLEAYKVWNELVKANKGVVKFGAIEAGGASPQVAVEFGNTDFMEALRKIRDAAPDSHIRPLWRGANGFLLKPSNREDLQHLLTNLAQDVASLDISDAQKRELLSIKVFDSQGIMSEVKSTIDIVADLYAKNHPITPEIAIPYSSGEAYPDEIYIQKALDAAKLLKASNIPLELCRISIKDMVGELDAKAASRLIPAIIGALKEAGLQVPFAMHLHNTGLANETYMAAIRACKKLDYPISVDMVECELMNQHFIEEQAWKNTGFASLLDLAPALEKEGINLTFDQSEKLALIAKLTHEAASEYAVVRADSLLTGEKLREYHIPGGGFTSFTKAVEAMGGGAGLANMLGISKKDALNVAGNALIAVGRLMGEPFAVTPGFQNKQLAALNLLQNMMNAKMLDHGMDVKKIKEIVLAKLNEEQVKDLFLKGLPPVVGEFLRGEMPAETLAKIKAARGEAKGELVTDTVATVHPAIRAAFPLRTGLLTDGIQPRLPAARKIAEELLMEGRIKATPLQAKAALQNLKKTNKKFYNLSEFQIENLVKLFAQKSITYNKPDGSNMPWQEMAVKEIVKFLTNNAGHSQKNASTKAKIIVEALKYKAVQTATTWALELGSTEDLRKAVQKHWWREPNPEDYGAKGRFNINGKPNKQGYERALEKAKKGLSPESDELEIMMDNVRTGKLPFDTAKQHSLTIMEKEREDIRVFVSEYLAKHSNKKLVASSISELLSKDKSMNNLGILTENLYRLQQGIINEKAKNGQYFVFPGERRLDITLDVLADQLADLAFATKSKELGSSLDVDSSAQNLYQAVSKNINAKRKDIEGIEITAKLDGRMVAVHIDTSEGPVHVKKGARIFTMEVMKMNIDICAQRDGEITCLVTSGKTFAGGSVLAKYTKGKEQEEVKSFEMKEAIGSGLLIAKTDLSLSLKKLKAHKQKADELDKTLSLQRQEIATLMLGKEEQSLLEKPEESALLESKEKKELIQEQDGLMADLRKRGYNAPALSVSPSSKLGHDDEIHIIGNRAGCAAKLYGDLRQAGRNNIRILYVAGDETTPVIAGSKSGEALEVASYNNQDVIIAKLKEIAAENPSKKIYFHPGWGFLSEKDDFVAMVEELAKPKKDVMGEEKGLDIFFVGPPSEAMSIAGGKKTFRDLVQKTAPDYNPRYFGNHEDIAPISALSMAAAPALSVKKSSASSSVLGSALAFGPVWGSPKKTALMEVKTSIAASAFSLALVEASSKDHNLASALELQAYIDEGFKDTNALDGEYRAYFNKIKAIGGDVMLKAVAGGGGKGIVNFKVDSDLSDELNYQNFVKIIQNNIAYSEKYFGNGEMLIEQCIRGETRHLEAQVIVTPKGAIVLGFRDCTMQNNQQKFIETNLCEGDYGKRTAEILSDTAKAAQEVVQQHLSRIGYKGVATLEMLILPDGTVKFLEVNTRVQVEHTVTERAIFDATGIQISLPVLNLLLSDPANLDKTPEEIVETSFGIKEEHLGKIIKPSKERVIHFRLNSKELNLKEGESLPSFLYDYVLTPEFTSFVADRTGATFIHGGLGKGKFDAQIGALCGNPKQVVAATNLIEDLIAVSRACHRDDGILSLDFTLNIHKLMYDEQGRFRTGFSTKTADEFLKAIKNNEVIVQMDHQHLGVGRKPKEGAFEEAFEKFQEIYRAKDHLNSKGKDELQLVKGREHKEEAIPSFVSLVGVAKKDLKPSLAKS